MFVIVVVYESIRDHLFTCMIPTSLRNPQILASFNVIDNRSAIFKQGQCKAWHMPQSGMLSVGVWKVWGEVEHGEDWWPPMRHQEIGPVDRRSVTLTTETKSKMAATRPCWMSGGGDHWKEPSTTLVIPNKPQKNRMNRPRRLSSNRRKPNPRWLPSWMSGRADHRK
jgi:hypothetical protein